MKIETLGETRFRFTSKGGCAKNETTTTDRQIITTPKITADAFAKAAAPIKQTAMFTKFITEAYLQRETKIFRF